MESKVAVEYFLVQHVSAFREERKLLFLLKIIFQELNSSFQVCCWVTGRAY
jgi:hypothetical protein